MQKSLSYHHLCFCGVCCAFGSEWDTGVRKQECGGGDGHLSSGEGASSAHTQAQPVGDVRHVLESSSVGPWLPHCTVK